jgi:hypothetical protein
MPELGTMTPSRVLWVRDVAKLRGCDVSTARAWMVTLEKQFGATVVGRRGNRLYATAASLRSVAPDMFDSTLEERVSDLERRFDTLLRRLNGRRSIVAG